MRTPTSDQHFKDKIVRIILEILRYHAKKGRSVTDEEQDRVLQDQTKLFNTDIKTAFFGDWS